MGRWTRIAGMAAGLVLATGLAACGGGDTSSDGAVLPQNPTTQPGSAPGSKSAQHFLRRWAAATTRMETTGKTQDYLKLTLRCGVCRDLARNIEHRYAVGGFIHWGGLRIRSVETPPNPGSVVLYTVHAFSAPMTLRDSSSRPVEHLPGRRVTYLVGVMTTSRSFGVTSVTAA